ncbi:hypothetical protein K2173_009887 [Erythroxylum novogranatense]|uniref:anthocyanidin 3-O-glucosyltransferase n=1 Tax=Erythroxylum novogranatense TaxID=1862640 RepID=A0AAV8SZ70_9ROSI|nr:hypothetical protein K2173_009887 [Erythroxylum novogranatense]
MKQAQMVFIPSLGASYLVSFTQFAKLLLDREESLSATILVINPSYGANVDTYSKQLVASIHKSSVKQVIVNHVMSEKSSLLVGLVVDVFCSRMIEVAKELGVPSYVFFTSSVAYKQTDPNLTISSFANPIPLRVLPSGLMNKYGRYTSSELEPYAVSSFKDCNAPPMYTVGPILNLEGQKPSGSKTTEHDKIMKWLDDQPEESVVFLCFGSAGSFHETHGHRFLWSIRKSAPKGEFSLPGEYTNYDEIFPDGFMQRTRNKGMVCGWAPQVQILSHKATGGFVSHCGWNSILESLWHSVPIVTWPMYGEQQLNAYEIVKELGLAVELTLDYNMKEGGLVMADDIVKSLKCVLEDGEFRNRVKAISENSKQAVLDGGSSSVAVDHLIKLMLEVRP